MYKYLTGLFAVAAALYLLPQQSLALTATVDSITPTATDISSMSEMPPDIAGATFMGELDETYTVVFNVDEEPGMVVTPGGDIDVTEGWTYDETAGTVTVAVQAKGYIGDQQGEMEEGMVTFTVAFVPAVEEGEDGPPAAMRPGFMATNVQEWELIPPSPDNIAFGFELTGPEGESGFFHMFIPDSMIDFLGMVSGQELAIEDLAVFNDDQQATLNIAEVSGGAYININVLFNENSSKLASTGHGDSSDMVTKTVVAKEKLPLSLAAKKARLKKGNKVTLYGWLKSGKKGQKIKILRKLKGNKKFVRVQTVRTKTDGYYRTKVKVKKTATFKSANKKTKSSPEKVTVKK